MAALDPIPPSPARRTYDAFAHYYDAFNSRYNFRRWTAQLLGAAEEVGLEPGDRPTLLDVACGTGLSAIPMVERGWAVTACDISDQMIKVARLKQIQKTRIIQADMRALPRFGRFRLAWAVNDAFNYLLSIGELVDAVTGLARNLDAGGILVFDVNTEATYAEFFDAELVVHSKHGAMIWRGRKGPTSHRIHEADVFDVDGARHAHRQRHFTQREVVDAFKRARVDLLAVKGESDGDLFDGLDEAVHTKAVYVGRPSR